MVYVLGESHGSKVDNYQESSHLSQIAADGTRKTGEKLHLHIDPSGYAQSLIHSMAYLYFFMLSCQVHPFFIEKRQFLDYTFAI